MEIVRSLRGLIARLLIITTASSAVGPGANAAAINTHAAIAADRERVLLLLDRPDVAAQLEAHGVKSADAKARIALLTDAEVAQLAADIDKAPAGGIVLAVLALYGVALVLQVVAGVVGMVHLAIKAVSTAVDLVANHGTSDASPLAAEHRDVDASKPENLAAQSAPDSAPADPGAALSVALPAVGDSWTYRLTESRGRHRQDRTQRVRIASVTQDTIVEQLGDQPGAPTRTLHREGGYLIRQGGVSLFSPYYSASDSTGSRVRIENIRNFDPAFCSADSICSMTASVVGKEIVRVPAGEFESTKVQVQHTWTARYPNGESGTRILSVWYSPLTKRAVKFSSQGSAGSSLHTDFDLVLDSYFLN